MLSLTRLFVLFLLLFLLLGCGPNFEDMAEQRLLYAENNMDDITIVAIEDVKNDGYIHGAKLAVDEINQQPGKLFKGRALRLEIENGGKTFEAVQSTVRDIAKNPAITAVLGHYASTVALPASVVYEKSNLIYFAPLATMKSLTGHNFNYVFRMIPSNKDMAEQFASVATLLGYKKLVLLYARDKNSRELAFLFENMLLNKNTLEDKSYQFKHKSSFYDPEDGSKRNHRPLISQFNQLDFDAIFLSSPAKPAANLVKQLREMGINVPILGRGTLISNDYVKAVGKAGENTITPIIYALTNPTTINKKFVANYTRVYKEPPNYKAALAYDSVHLLAYVIRRANSTIPSLLASTLHYFPFWQGVTGLHAFNQDGDGQGKKYYFQVLKQSTDLQHYEWQFLPEIYKPYLMTRFQKHLKKNQRGELNDFTKKLSQRLSRDDYKALQLDVLHEILRFKMLGIIYENTDNGKVISDYNIVKSLAERKNFRIKDCEISFSTLEKKKIQQALIGCYGKISIVADAIYVTKYPNVNQNFIKNLNSILKFYKIPLFKSGYKSIESLGISISLSPSTINFNDPVLLKRYKAILHNTKMHDFQDKLQYFFHIEADLQLFLDNGIDISRILSLSPIVFSKEKFSQ